MTSRPSRIHVKDRTDCETTNGWIEHIDREIALAGDLDATATVTAHRRTLPLFIDRGHVARNTPGFLGRGCLVYCLVRVSVMAVAVIALIGRLVIHSSLGGIELQPSAFNRQGELHENARDWP